MDFLTRTEEINQKLYEKLAKEYDGFIEHLKTLLPDEIINNSYEKVFKEDILLCFESNDLDYERAKALLSLDKPLDELYDEWLGTDCTYMDMLRDCIDNRTDVAVKEMKAKSKALER